MLGLQIGERPGLVGEARALFSLACRYAESVRTPRLLITTGVMGTGKSTVARMVAARLGAVVIRTDAVRKRFSGLPLRERVENAFGEGLYAPEMGRRTYEEALRLAWELLAAGWPVIVDGSFSKAGERRDARDLAACMGVRFTALWCEAPEDVVARRLRERAGDHREVSDGRPDLLGQHRRRYEPPAGEADVVRVDTAVAADASLAPLLDRGSVGAGALGTRW